MSPSVKEAVLEGIRSQIEFRERKAEEYPGDPRNSVSIKHMKDLENEVSEAPEDHQAFQDIACILYNGVVEILLSGFGPSWQGLSRMGFQGGPSLSLESLPAYIFEGQLEGLEENGEWADTLEWLLRIAQEDRVPAPVRLQALSYLRDQVERIVELEEADIVEAARKEGVSWSEIATALGRTKQAVWKQYANPDEIPAGDLPE